MVRAELSATNLQNSPRRFFRFRPLPLITQNQNQGAKRICRLQAVISEQFLSGPQSFSSQRFRLRESPSPCENLSQIVFRSCPVCILVAKASPPDVECLSIYFFRLGRFSAR